MILCLDVGNSQIFGGVFADANLRLRFRYNTNQTASSDQIGVFLKTVLQENAIDPKHISHIALCSVVPHLDYSLRSACKKYFAIDPFVLQPGVKTGLNIRYHNPMEVGSDRIANAIAAIHDYPQHNVLIIDFGTATTFCAVSANREYLGGAILPGMRISMHALQSHAAKLSSVEIIKPQNIIGRSTAESIQSGLYYAQLGSVKEISARITKAHFPEDPPVIIGTGGFAHLFEAEQCFTTIQPDLVLQGLRYALLLAKGSSLG